MWMDSDETCGYNLIDELFIIEKITLFAMILCDGNYDWVHMAFTRCIIGNPSEAG